MLKNNSIVWCFCAGYYTLRDILHLSVKPENERVVKIIIVGKTNISIVDSKRIIKIILRCRVGNLNKNENTRQIYEYFYQPGINVL